MRWVVVVAALAACSFSPRPADGPTDAGPDAPPDPITCGDLTCDPAATCDPTGPACVCNAGFTGDGVTCTDVDECATENGNCPAACANLPGSFECYVPETCAEIRAHVPDAVDGDFTLYLEGDAEEDWTAYCADMAGSPREYLTLPRPSFAQYTAGGDSDGTDVRTTYARVRLILDPLAIDIADRTFATSTGQLEHSGRTTVTSMPFGVAMDCRGAGSEMGVAEIDLRDTPFEIAGSFASGGFNASGTSMLRDDGQRASLSGGGFCGWHGPAGLPADPFNDNTGGTVLPLAYDD